MTQRVILNQTKVCENWVRFDSPDKKAAVKNIYVRKSVPGIEQAHSIAIDVHIGTAAPVPAPETAVSDDALASLVGA